MDLFEFDKNEKTIISPLGLKTTYDFIIGSDEAGRGPASGGVWAGAVCFFNDVDKNLFKKLNDSKKLSPKIREELFDLIIQNSFYSIKSVDVETIEKINILNASLLAMKLAVKEVIDKLKTKNILTLVDGNKLIKDFPHPQKYIIKGDMLSANIAGASILAKVSRDNYMLEIDKQFPQYDWKNNKGYLTKKHIEAIKKYGICKYHRKSFLKNILKGARNNSDAV